jgi:cysteine desulfurase
MDMRRVYLDHNATSPCRPEALEAMSRAAEDLWGNPSSAHAEGRLAKAVLEDAREVLAEALGAEKEGMVFTSGGTEANNLAIQGVLNASSLDEPHVAMSAIEHPSVLEIGRMLEAVGVAVTRIPCTEEGFVEPRSVDEAVRPETALVSVMHANNEVGTIQPVAEIASAARARGIVVHCDAVQTFGRIPVAVRSLGADLVTVSAHKMGGPKGVGALYVAPAVRERFEPVFRGGPQERGRRPGTENVAGVAGFAAAVQSAVSEVESESARLRALRDRLRDGVLSLVPGSVVNGDPRNGLPNTLNISFPDVPGDALMMALDLDGIAVSTGSACAVGAHKPSHVLQAMRLGSGRRCGPIRFSMGWTTTAADLDRLFEVLPAAMRRLRESGAVCDCYREEAR